MRTNILAVLVSTVLVAGATQVSVAAATYTGTAKCKMCHGMKHKEIVEGYFKSPHPKAMQKADAENAIIGDFSSAPFTKDKVAFTLGRGTDRNEQAYLDANFQVLPATWDVKGKTWKPTAAADGSTQCIGCHATGYDVEKKTFTEPGVGCEACHGPGSDHVAKPTKETAFIPSTLSPKLQAEVCGSCHSAGKDTSGKCAFPTGFKPGDDLTKSFVDAKPAGPGRNQQYSEFLQSKHNEVGLTCTSCHENHNLSGLPGQLKKPVAEGCLTCHASKIKDLKTHAPSAAADATCATCHMPGGQHRFKKSGG